MPVDRKVLLAKLQTMQEWLLIAYAISLPLTMTGSWILLTAGVIVWAVQGAVRYIRKDEHDHGVFVPPPLPLKWPLVALALAVALSGVMNSGARGRLGEGWHCFWSLKAIFIYFWASSVFHFRPHVAKLAIQALLCVSAVAGIWGAIQQVFNFHPFGYPYLQGTGFLAGPMPFAGQMQIFSLMAIALLLSGAYKQLSAPLSNKYVFGFITLANLAGLYFALQRSAWLGGIAAIMVLAAMVSWKMFFRSALVVLVVAVVSYYAVPDVHARLDSALSGSADMATRLKIWNIAVTKWNSSPIFGVGWMSFGQLGMPELAVHNKDLDHAHSNVLQFLATTGIIGTLTYFWLCIATIVACIKSHIRARIEKDPLSIGLSIGMLASMVSLMISGLFEFNFGTAQVRLAQWFVLGLLAYTATTRIEHKRSGPSSSDTIPDSLPSV